MVFDEDPAHRAGGGGEEIIPVGSIRQHVVSQQSEEAFVGQVAGTQRVVAPLAPHQPPGDTTQFGVDGLGQAIASLGYIPADVVEEGRQFTGEDGGHAAGSTEK